MHIVYLISTLKSQKMKSSNGIKKAILFILSGMLCMSSFAQLVVVENGNVGVGTSNPLSKFAVNDSGSANYTVYAKNTSAANLAYAIRAVTNTPAPGSGSNAYNAIFGSLNSGNGWAKGVWGQSSNASAQSTGRAYGVYGLASNATNGYNYGVFGVLSGSNNGAAVYGASRGYTDEDTQGNYAGYFKGNVYVSSNLTVGNKRTDYQADIEGTLCATTLLESSDSRLKENIINIDENHIASLKQIRGVNYSLKRPEVANVKLAQKGDTSDVMPENTIGNAQMYNKKHNGFIAQEIQKVYPDLVYANNEGTLAIDYLGFIPIIVEALKKQDELISTQAQEIQVLKSYIDALGKKSIELSSSSSILYQNSPNPFNISTTVKYYIDPKAKEAVISIYSVNGKVVKFNKIIERGSGSIVIEKNELSTGIYTYTLIVDGIVIDTKNMLLTN